MACCSASVNPWVAEPLDRPAGALVEDLHQPLDGLGTWALPVDGSRPGGRIHVRVGHRPAIGVGDVRCIGTRVRQPSHDPVDHPRRSRRPQQAATAW